MRCWYSYFWNTFRWVIDDTSTLRLLDRNPGIPEMTIRKADKKFFVSWREMSDRTGFVDPLKISDLLLALEVGWYSATDDRDDAQKGLQFDQEEWAGVQEAGDEWLPCSCIQNSNSGLRSWLSKHISDASTLYCSFSFSYWLQSSWVARRAEKEGSSCTSSRGALRLHFFHQLLAAISSSFPSYFHYYFESGKSWWSGEGFWSRAFMYISIDDNIISRLGVLWATTV